MLKILSSGFYTTIQDLGRFGYGDIGVPVSGAMDLYSAKLGNHILGNNHVDAVLEITLSKFSCRFDKETIICISGADLSPKLNDNNIALNTAINIDKGTVLTFDTPVYGVRSYLAVKGGFQTQKILGSRSFFNGVTDQFLIKKNDIIPFEKFNSNLGRSFSAVKINVEHFNSKTITVYKGPEFGLLSKEQQEKLTNTEFAISKDNSRMGYRLEELIPNDFQSMLTSAVLPGTVQLTPSGELIVLMRDGQITGGYPRILQLTDTAINILAQKTTKNTFKFKVISI